MTDTFHTDPFDMTDVTMDLSSDELWILRCALKDKLTMIRNEDAHADIFDGAALLDRLEVELAPWFTGAAEGSER